VAGKIRIAISRDPTQRSKIRRRWSRPTRHARSASCRCVAAQMARHCAKMCCVHSGWPHPPRSMSNSLSSNFRSLLAVSKGVVSPPTGLSGRHTGPDSPQGDGRPTASSSWIAPSLHRRLDTSPTGRHVMHFMAYQRAAETGSMLPRLMRGLPPHPAFLWPMERLVLPRAE
jgi:hypothetical protein